MVIFSNFYKEKEDENMKLRCDISVDGSGDILPDDKLWISTDVRHGHYLNEQICDGYLLAGMAFGMYYGQDVKICGRVSKKLYNNLMNYGQQILLNHDPGLKKINIQVDGFLTNDDFCEHEYIVGAPCSFGVDALCTLYDRWLNETDSEDRVNRVFSFNCGINGMYGETSTNKLRDDRTKEWKKGFGELGIPIIDVDTNIHLFLHNRMYVYAAACYLGRYFCILNLQGGVNKYYIPSGFSYRDIMNFGYIPYKLQKRGAQDIGLGYEEPFFAPLLTTEHLDIVLDGGQYQRTEKTEKISHWNFTYKYLNVCQPGHQTLDDYSKNCSRCTKCTYTMFALELLGKLDCYQEVFDTEYFYANKYSIFCEMVQKGNDDLLVYDTLEFAREKHINIPTEEEVRKYYFYKWRFADIDSYLAIANKVFDEYRKSKIIIWGAGWIGSHVLAAMDVLGLRAQALVDTDITKQGQIFCGYTVSDPQKTISNNDVIFICGVDIFDDVKKNVGDNVICIDIVSALNGQNGENGK